MKLAILGIGKKQSIGQACGLLEIHGKRFITDCGYEFAGSNGRMLSPPALHYIEDASVDAVFFTHVHFDHIGAIALLLPKLKPDARIYMTPQTSALLTFIYEDLRNPKHGNQKTAPTFQDIIAIDQAISIIEKPGAFEAAGVAVYAHPAGHMNGATSFIFKTESGLNAMITGDYCTHNQPMTLGALLPPKEWLPQIIVGYDLTNADPSSGYPESWSWDSEYERFVRDVKETNDNGGSVVVPAFRFNRAQTVAYRAHQYGIRAYLDGSASRVAEKLIGLTWSDRDVPISRSDFQFVTDHDMRKSILDSRNPFVVVAPGGMANGGQVEFWLKHTLSDPQSLIAFVGYVAPGSTAHDILTAPEGREIELASSGERVIKRARTAKYKLSSHETPAKTAAYPALLGADTVFATHGTLAAKEALADNLRTQKIQCIIPEKTPAPYTLYEIN